MPDAIDLLETSQTAVFEALDGREQLTALSGVFQHVPENTEGSLTIIGDIRFEDAGTKHEPAEDITIEVITVYRGPGRAPLLAIMHQQYLALAGDTLSAEGVEFSSVRRIGGGSDGPAEDGITYAGVSTFTFTAEPA